MSAGGFFDKFDEYRLFLGVIVGWCYRALMLVIAPGACVILENGKSPLGAGQTKLGMNFAN
ncbi:hypothetical protein C2I18_05600 [Paenibacillus sp. PK3_47]|nr:hypothetical protein C2I18_05600 [Paenibacillus sp. PK3_47]